MEKEEKGKSVEIEVRWRDCFKFWVSGFVFWLILVLIAAATFYASA